MESPGARSSWMILHRDEVAVDPFVSGAFAITHRHNDNLDEGWTQTRYCGSSGILVMLSQSVGAAGERFYQRVDDERLQTNVFGRAFGVSTFLF